jgi:predicted protein tyrosine phosphatase
MDGNEENMVMCCFSGEWIEQKSAVTIVLFIPHSDETQTLYAKLTELKRVVLPEIPLHPDISDPSV